ncbi:MAG TPA: zf-HC2 domain-containing protein [Gemmatimonadales bacterium]|nr:zf-HC2 domain-containing protein [Gemmatimonadales bacterium]
MHPDDEQLQRWLDHELTPEAERTVGAHLEGCDACRFRAERARLEVAELRGALTLLDHPVPRISAGDIAIAARRSPQRAGLRWAAAVLAAVGLAGVAYAAPGSPVPGWIASLSARVSAREQSVPPPALERSGQADLAGIAVPPGRRLVVSFDSAQVEGEAIVTIAAGAELTVRAPAGAATYDAGLERLTIGNGGSRASYAVTIPADAPWVEILVAGERLLLKAGDRVTTRDGTGAAGGSYRLPLRR